MYHRRPKIIYKKDSDMKLTRVPGVLQSWVVPYKKYNPRNTVSTDRQRSFVFARNVSFSDPRNSPRLKMSIKRAAAF